MPSKEWMGAMLASIQIAEHKALAGGLRFTFRRPTKIFEDGINLMKLNYLLAFDRGVIASTGGIPLIEEGIDYQGQSGVREARIPRTRSLAEAGGGGLLTNTRRRTK